VCDCSVQRMLVPSKRREVERNDVGVLSSLLAVRQ
jgi:hypothetical protein